MPKLEVNFASAKTWRHAYYIFVTNFDITHAVVLIKFLSVKEARFVFMRIQRLRVINYLELHAPLAISCLTSDNFQEN